MRAGARYDAGLRCAGAFRPMRVGCIPANVRVSVDLRTEVVVWPEFRRMPSLEEFAYDFDRQVQARGREYFRRKAAKIVGADARHVEAVVAGGNRYKVKVAWDETGEPTYECACPFFRDRGEPCKHLWATLLQADKDGVLSGDVEDVTPPRDADDETPDADAAADNPDAETDPDED